MKVLMIAPEPFLEARGTPISVYQRIYALSSLGYQVDLLTYHLGQDINLPGVTVHRIPNVPFIKTVRVGPSLSKLFLDVLLFLKAFVLLAGGGYGVIHTHEEAAFFCVALAALFRTTHVYDMHSSLPRQLENFAKWNYQLFVKLFLLLERSTIATCDAVITISSDLEDHVRRVNPDKRQVLIENLPIQAVLDLRRPLLVDSLREKLHIDGRRPIVYTGNFEPYQGIDLLVDTIDLLRIKHPDVIFLLVGGQPRQVAYWQNEVQQRQLADHTMFVGSVPVEEVTTYLELAEILISPRLDGTSIPLKIYSYLLSGKPTVATDVPSHTQVLNEEIAMLVAPTKEAVATGLSTLLVNPELRTQLGLNARRYVEERNILAGYIGKLDQLYAGLPQSRKVTVAPASPTVEKR